MDTPIIHKDCTKCGRNLPASEFSKCRRNKSGLQPKCKGCERAYREANREKIAEQKKAYHEANREKRAEYQKTYREANREKIAEYKKAYQEDNREKIAKYKKAHYEANREEIEEKHKAYREANRELLAEKQRVYNAANPEKARAHGHNRRARKRNAEGSHTAAQVSARFAAHGDSCVYCGSKEDLHVEHMKPLSKGGSNWASNIAPACAKCNLSKNDKWGAELLRWIEQNCTVESTKKIFEKVLRNAE